LERNLRSSFKILDKASFSCDQSFIVLATVITIINYAHKTFIVQAARLQLIDGKALIGLLAPLKLANQMSIDQLFYTKNVGYLQP